MGQRDGVLPFRQCSERIFYHNATVCYTLLHQEGTQISSAIDGIQVHRPEGFFITLQRTFQQRLRLRQFALAFVQTAEIVHRCQRKRVHRPEGFFITLSSTI